MAEESHKTKDRSPNFPFISLVRAVQRAEQIFNKEKRGLAPYSVIATHWDYSPTSSGALQTAAALKSYGLIEEEGSGASRKLRLSDMALRIILDKREDGSERLSYLRRAALMPPVAMEISKKFADGFSDANLNHYLVVERGFSQANAIKVVEIIKHNQKFVGSSPQDSKSNDDEIQYEEHIGVASMTTPQSIIQTASAGAVALPNIAAVPMKQERVIAPDAEVLLQFHGAPTWETYDFLEKYIALRKSVLKKSV